MNTNSRINSTSKTRLLKCIQNNKTSDRRGTEGQFFLSLPVSNLFHDFIHTELPLKIQNKKAIAWPNMWWWSNQRYCVTTSWPEKNVWRRFTEQSSPAAPVLLLKQWQSSSGDSLTADSLISLALLQPHDVALELGVEGSGILFFKRTQ